MFDNNVWDEFFFYEKHSLMTILYDGNFLCDKRCKINCDDTILWWQNLRGLENNMKKKTKSERRKNDDQTEKNYNCDHSKNKTVTKLKKIYLWQNFKKNWDEAQKLKRR